MSEKKMTGDANALIGPSGLFDGNKPSFETSPAAPEMFVAKGSKDLEIVLPRAVIEGAVRKLIEVTGARDYHDAMELVWFKSDPKSDPGTRESVSMLLTLYRSARDGNVRPPISLEDLYAEKYNEIVSKDRCFTGNPAP